MTEETYCNRDWKSIAGHLDANKYVSVLSSKISPVIMWHQQTFRLLEIDRFCDTLGDGSLTCYGVDMQRCRIPLRYALTVPHDMH